jgi:glycosyltransferase involved in cell wall biosynthesis
MGGAQRVLSIVMRELVCSGYDVTVITNHTSSSDFYSISSNINRFSTELFTPSGSIVQAIANNLKRIRKIRQLILKESPDTVFSFMTETNVITILATLLTGKRVIISERSDPEKDKKSAIWNVLRKITYRKATLVTSNSKSALDYLAKMVAEGKLVYLPNPVEGCDGVSIPDEDDEQRKIILVVARLHPAKGIDILIEAMSKLKSNNHEYQVWVAGDGPEKEKLINQAKDLAVDQNIQWLGEVNDLIPLYKKASLFVLPSRREGMPNALLEAMSCGLPVIISNASPGPLEYVVNNESGLIFESGSSSKLADAIDKLLSDDKKRHSIGSKSIDKVKPFLIPNILPEWENVIFHNHKTGTVSVAR